MRRLFPYFLLLLISCRFSSGQEKLRGIVTGDWLVLYADHQLKNRKQREIYGRIQDSVIRQRGLKLVSFFEDGSFRQMDSLQRKGQWAISPDRKLYLAKGGNGFDDLKAGFLKYEKNILQVVEYMQTGGESIQLVWHLEKVKDPFLFKPENNAWRKKPGQPEPDKQLKERLSAMLIYYSAYFKLVSAKASYFIPGRVILPFSFYQHAMGVKSFNPESDFAGLFFNAEQSEKAYGYLEKTMHRLQDQFPLRDNYVEEYSLFMEKMAGTITGID